MNPGDPLDDYAEVWVLEFALREASGEPPEPLGMVALEIRTGELRHLDDQGLAGHRRAPFGTDSRSLVVVFEASDQIGGFLALGWRVPERIVDLHAELRCRTNGRTLPAGDDLLGALVALDLMSPSLLGCTNAGRLASRGRPSKTEERCALLDACQIDVQAVAALWSRMQPSIDLPRALLRGSEMVAVARMERLGIPLDCPTLLRVQESWGRMRAHVVADIDREYCVFDGQTFCPARWELWLAENDISWPRTPDGHLLLDAETFRQMARAHPAVAPIRELCVSLSDLHLADLEIGWDGRNRCATRPFQSRTGRNQPSSSRCIFGSAVWIRGFIRPPPGMGLAYIDWSQQEYGIAAALSGDRAMLAAYATGDPYLAFARHIGTARDGSSPSAISSAREHAKQCILGVQYAMGAETLAGRIGRAVAYARELLRAHRQTYPAFWAWSDAAVDCGMLHNHIWTAFGWTLHVDRTTNARTLRNFPMQANGAEMLRLACSLATERGIAVCASLHDALLIEAPLDLIDAVVAGTQNAMAEASRIVLGGLALRTHARVVRFPDCYADPRGARMWATVMRCLEQVDPVRDAEVLLA